MTENKGDLISREALKKAITEATYNFEQIPIRVDKLQEIIDNAPTVERPQGEWIITSEDTEGIHHIACPFCKYEKGSDFEPYIRVTFDKLPPFCEKCGADMRGKAE